MKTGSQADLIRHLASEYGIEIKSRNSISKLVIDKDYRIITTPQGKIKIEETAKALVDSGFGKRAEKLKSKKEHPPKATEKSKDGDQPPHNGETDEDLNDYLTGKKPIDLNTPPSIIHKYQELQKAEKDRIANDVKLNKLIDVDEVGEKSFNLWRHVRDEIQTMKDRLIIKIRSAESEHEAEQIYNKESHRILNSIVSGFENLTDSDVKKKLVQRLTR